MTNRRKPDYSFTGVTLEQWRASNDNLQWAQQEPRFKVMLSVLLNECGVAHQSAAGCGEGRAFGRVEGYHMALDVLRSLAQRPPKAAAPVQETFDESPDHASKDKYQLD